MHILGEPVRRQFVTDPLLLGFAIDHGAGGGELIAQPEIIEEAGDVLILRAALGLARDQFRDGRKFAGRSPFARFDRFGRMSYLLGRLSKLVRET